MRLVYLARFGLAAGISAIALTATAASAQQQSDSEGANAGSDMDNIILVTGQKRTQDILSVPTAISAIDETQLDAAQVTDFSDLTRLSPSVTVTDGGNSASSTVSMRGIGTFGFSTSIEPSVSVVVDDVALLQQSQAFGPLSDVARIEVLRGPQDSLFGKNASAGVINIVTKGPTSTFSGYVEGTVTDDDQQKVVAMLSGPLTPDLGFRLNGYYSDRDGYITNLETDEKVNAEESYGVSGKLTYSSGIMDLALTGNFSKTNSNGSQQTYYYLAPGVLQNGQPIDTTGVDVGLGNDKVRLSDPKIADSRQYVLAAKADFDLGFASLTSVTSYQYWHLNTGNDLDFSAAPTLYQSGPYKATQFAQELRLTSPATGVFDYLVGLYYANGDTDRTFTRETAPYLSFLRRNWDSTASTETLAAFAQLGYDLSPSTSLTLGGRINHEKVGVYFSDNLSTPPAVYEGNASDTALTGKASLQHYVADDVMVYASVASGYKGQAYDIVSGFDQTSIDNLVKPEHSVSYETGVKGRFWDNRASFSITGFWTDYRDFQAQGVDSTAGVPQFVLKNVGKLRTRGIEFEGSVRPVQGLDLFGSAAYVDATITSYPDAACYPFQTEAEGCMTIPGSTSQIQDLSGGDLANSPEFKFNVGGSYEVPVTNSANVFFTANYSWQDDVNFSLSQDPETIQPAYGIANASFGLREAENRNWELSVFVNNLFDTTYASSITNFSTNGYSDVAVVQTLARDYRRYAGIRLRIGFGANN
ncbi:TonB-dependent receptor [Altericroceibacterium endophyticum]|uniref:TonB-dependent receptor n=1 Tax=Altericroceibacterium endophyticum TaxID=1808508 RepID=UPI00301D7570